MLVSGIRGTVTAAGKSQDGKRLSIALMIKNVSDAEMRIALVGPAPVATDNEGADYAFKAFSGATQCPTLDPEGLRWCFDSGAREYVDPMSYSKLLSRSKTTLNFSFDNKGGGSSGDTVSFSANFALLAAKNIPLGDAISNPKKGSGEQTAIESRFDRSTIGFGIPNIKLVMKQ
jgi:hypothetical protein